MKPIDVFIARLEAVIHTTIETQELTMVEAVGALELIKHDIINSETSEEAE